MYCNGTRVTRRPQNTKSEWIRIQWSHKMHRRGLRRMVFHSNKYKVMISRALLVIKSYVKLKYFGSICFFRSPLTKPTCICATQALLSSYNIVGESSCDNLQFVPINLSIDLSQMHSRDASYKTIIFAWFNDVVVIVYFTDFQDIAAPCRKKT